jgi:hypothetical protein
MIKVSPTLASDGSNRGEVVSHFEQCALKGDSLHSPMSEEDAALYAETRASFITSKDAGDWTAASGLREKYRRDAINQIPEITPENEPTAMEISGAIWTKLVALAGMERANAVLEEMQTMEDPGEIIGYAFTELLELGLDEDEVMQFLYEQNLIEME